MTGLENNLNTLLTNDSQHLTVLDSCMSISLYKGEASTNKEYCLLGYDAILVRPSSLRKERTALILRVDDKAELCLLLASC
jgi:hypothetical protein